MVLRVLLLSIKFAQVVCDTEERCVETCQEQYCQDYRGCMSSTVSGHTCQRWDAQQPHKHRRIYSVDSFGNNCRNPATLVKTHTHSTIWCYTTDPQTIWEECAPDLWDAEVDVLAESSEKDNALFKNDRWQEIKPWLWRQASIAIVLPLIPIVFIVSWGRLRKFATLRHICFSLALNLLICLLIACWFKSQITGAIGLQPMKVNGTSTQSLKNPTPIYAHMVHQYDWRMLSCDTNIPDWLPNDEEFDKLPKIADLNVTITMQPYSWTTDFTNVDSSLFKRKLLLLLMGSYRKCVIGGGEKWKDAVVVAIARKTMRNGEVKVGSFGTYSVEHDQVFVRPLAFKSHICDIIGHSSFGLKMIVMRRLFKCSSKTPAAMGPLAFYTASAEGVSRYIDATGRGTVSEWEWRGSLFGFLQSVAWAIILPWLLMFSLICSSCCIRCLRLEDAEEQTVTSGLHAAKLETNRPTLGSKFGQMLRRFMPARRDEDNRPWTGPERSADVCLEMSQVPTHSAAGNVVSLQYQGSRSAESSRRTFGVSEFFRAYSTPRSAGSPETQHWPNSAVPSSGTFQEPPNSWSGQAGRPLSGQLPRY